MPAIYYLDNGTGSVAATAVWRLWSSIGTATSTACDGVWGCWLGTSAGTATSVVSTVTDNVWVAWSGQTVQVTRVPVQYQYNPAPPPSPEEVERQRAERQAREEEYQRQLAAERRKTKAAEQRAKKLLLQNLNLEQKLAYVRGQKFRVQAPSGRLYELRHGWAGNVEEVKDGKPVRRFCIHPSQRVPNADNLLAQKLMLESDEEGFRRIANQTQLAACN